MLASTVARMATPMTWITCQVAWVREEPCAIAGSGTADNAVTKVVWMVAPIASPRSARRNRIQLIGVFAPIWDNCQVFRIKTP